MVKVEQTAPGVYVVAGRKYDLNAEENPFARWVEWKASQRAGRHILGQPVKVSADSMAQFPVFFLTERGKRLFAYAKKVVGRQPTFRSLARRSMTWKWLVRDGAEEQAIRVGLADWLRDQGVAVAESVAVLPSPQGPGKPDRRYVKLVLTEDAG